MTEKNLERANQLRPLIAAAKDNIARWDSATSFKSSSEISCLFQSGTGNYSYVRPAHIPFDVAKALSLAGYNKELKQLEDEFNSL